VRVLDLLVVSCLARVEVPAAIWRKRRLGELSEKDARLLTGEFAADYYYGQCRRHGASITQSVSNRVEGSKSSRPYVAAWTIASPGC
jgi:hypothetical protein